MEEDEARRQRRKFLVLGNTEPEVWSDRAKSVEMTKKLNDVDDDVIVP